MHHKDVLFPRGSLTESKECNHDVAMPNFLQDRKVAVKARCKGVRKDWSLNPVKGKTCPNVQCKKWNFVDSKKCHECGLSFQKINHINANLMTSTTSKKRTNREKFMGLHSSSSNPTMEKGCKRATVPIPYLPDCGCPCAYLPGDECTTKTHQPLVLVLAMSQSSDAASSLL